MSDTVSNGVPALECSGLRKTYAGEHEFRLGAGGDGLSFSVGRGDLFALVGPSGCGKTTTLRIIGGFVPADEGRVLIEGIDVTRCPPYARPTNTVFQSYALFPHMSVGANVGFGLAMERVNRRERQTRVAEALELVGLGGSERRRVSELSGGQQQRAALARAIVKRPAILLLDEPLGALDLQLRKQMQDELARLKTSTSTTFIHVTHDQEEACAIADRIAVMKDGRVVQVDDPFSLYRRPRTTFVASFLDAGTIVRGRSVRHGDIVEIAGPELTVRAPAGNGERAVSQAAVIPADKIRVHEPATGVAEHPDAAGTITRIVFTGTNFLSYVLVGAELEIKVSVTAHEAASLGEGLAVGRPVQLSWSPNDVILVDDADTPPAIAPSQPPASEHMASGA
jgi:ABC-type Fe3+/spermidine/putrescine transport system ATPase subunit